MEQHNQSLLEELNDEFKDMILPVTVFIGIETVIGFFGNLLVIYVFICRYHECSFKYFVLCLASTDLICTLTIMPSEILSQMKWFVYPSDEICKIKSYFNIFTFSCQTFCLLAVAVDRYRKVCVPVEWQIQPRVACWLCLLISALAAILAIPVPFFFGRRRIRILHKNTNITVTVCEKDEQFVESKRPFEYMTPVDVIIMTSLFSMFIIYIIVARKLFGLQIGTSAVKKHRPSHSSSAHKNTSESQVSLSADVVESHSYKASRGFDNSYKVENLKKISYRGNGSPGEVDNDKETDRELNKYTPELSGQIRPSKSKQIITESERLSERNDPNEIFQCEIVSSEQGHTSDVADELSNSMCIFYKGVTTNSQSKMTWMQKDELVKTVHAAKSENNLKQKTVVMLVLTSVFLLTAICYRIMVHVLLVANSNVLQNTSNSERTAYFFFLRLYFINHVINPVVYYAFDMRFRKVIKSLFKSLFHCSV